MLFYNLVHKNSIEYNNHMRTRVLEETRTFSQGVAFSSRSWGVTLIGLGLSVFVSLVSIVGALCQSSEHGQM